MNAEKFVEYYRSQKDQVLFNFKIFFEQTLAKQTPPKEKIILNVSDDFNKITGQTKEAILTNLYLNKSFRAHDQYRTNTVVNLANIFQNGTAKAKIQDYEAQLIYLLHSSKMNGTLLSFNLMFSNFNTIQVVDFQMYDLNYLFIQIKQNLVVLEALGTVVKDFTGKNVKKLDFDEIKIEFFKSQFRGLNGFAGIKKIYVSSNRIEELARLTSDKLFDKKDQLILLLLLIVYLIFQEK
ncbi:hypothetical protein BpHYR1_042209 [Brachionus plicatilis]|uniref:Uncharacterized protein n=1 Tax=Brachionus plicatilis TaxID=10195 RepID=A0A3M7QCC9_BRAPC|nr:hypothetical protein BpHYR1_042209 [Brachionus plicatilis]